MSRKELKVVVDLNIRGVSCPGVHLSAKEDIYLSMCFMGQCCQSERLPAIFPLLVHEKMTFEKIFRHAVDPGDVAVMLAYETVRIELVQLIPPVGDMLACFEEDARRFLFPEPKLVPSFSGVDREVLMTREPHFPGIAPRLEFSTSTTITECSANTEVNIYPSVHVRPVVNSDRPRISSPQRKPPNFGRRRAGKMCREHRHSVRRLPTSIPRSRSLSPRKAGNARRLAQLDPASKPIKGITEDDSSSSESHDPLEDDPYPDPSTVLQPYGEQTRHNRSQSTSDREWEEVYERVRGLLTTPKAVRRLVSLHNFVPNLVLCGHTLLWIMKDVPPLNVHKTKNTTKGATHSEIEDVLARRSISPGPPS